MEEAYSITATKEEMKYIKNIGKYHYSTKDYSRKVMLEKYYHALLQRKEWGNLDPNEILGYLTTEIARA